MARAVFFHDDAFLWGGSLISPGLLLYKFSSYGIDLSNVFGDSPFAFGLWIINRSASVDIFLPVLFNDEVVSQFSTSGNYCP